MPWTTPNLVTLFGMGPMSQSASCSQACGLVVAGIGKGISAKRAREQIKHGSSLSKTTGTALSVRTHRVRSVSFVATAIRRTYRSHKTSFPGPSDATQLQLVRTRYRDSAHLAHVCGLRAGLPGPTLSPLRAIKIVAQSALSGSSAGTWRGSKTAHPAVTEEQQRAQAERGAADGQLRTSRAGDDRERHDDRHTRNQRTKGTTYAAGATLS